ncbi:MAG TPA: hypothetical protein PLP04_03545 [Bryobacteraceae bacterium]|nr:hypothetical protein [Bryobacteraceae bacterium]
MRSGLETFLGRRGLCRRRGQRAKFIVRPQPPVVEIRQRELSRGLIRR